MEILYRTLNINTMVFLDTITDGSFMSLRLSRLWKSYTGSLQKIDDGKLDSKQGARTQVISAFSQKRTLEETVA